MPHPWSFHLIIRINQVREIYYKPHILQSLLLKHKVVCKREKERSEEFPSLLYTHLIERNRGKKQ